MVNEALSLSWTVGAKSISKISTLLHNAYFLLCIEKLREEIWNKKSFSQYHGHLQFIGT